MSFRNSFQLNLVLICAIVTGMGLTCPVAAMQPGTWTAAPDLPENRSAMATAVIDGSVYLLGGSLGSSPTATVFAYDPISTTISEKQEMSVPRSRAAAAVVDGKIYLIGGADELDALATVEVYDPASDTWETLADMPEARWSPAAVVNDGKIYVIGGGTSHPRDEFRQVYATLQVYDPSTNTWDTAADMPTARCALGAFVYDGLIYAVGGSVYWWTFTGAVEIYDPVTDTWSTGAAIPVPRESFATVQTGGYV